MNRLKINVDDLVLYQAGLPHFPRNFTRDSIISTILMKDSEMLKNQLIFCARKQGKKKDAYTGEESGKIFHEYPGVKIRGLSTLYNACDTTALFLIGHYYYFNWTKDRSFIEEQKDNIDSAISYILNHLKDGLFFEDPKSSGAEKFGLKVTYWKDSVVYDRVNGEPIYPAVFTLAHIMNLCAIRFASRILESEKLERVAEEMKKALLKLWDDDLGLFFIALDEKGPIKGVSSDSLHSLFYLEKGDLSDTKLKKIIKSSEKLETPIGYRTLEEDLAKKLGRDYHSRTVWPFEQAVINVGAKKFDLDKVEEVSSRVIQHLDTDPEIFVLKNGKFEKGGCDPQLWTIAAKFYFGKK